MPPSKKIQNAKEKKRKDLRKRGVTGNFVGGGGVQQIKFRTKDRENRDLRAVAP